MAPIDEYETVENPRWLTKRPLRLAVLAVGVYVGVSLPVGAIRFFADREACDQREVTSIAFDRCMELRRAGRFPPFGAWGASPDLDRVVEAIISEGSYPPPPYTGPAPQQFEVGPPTTR